MKTIYKYTFDINDDIEIEMPAGAEIVHVGVDPQGQAAIWAKVNTKDPAVAQRFNIRGTGHDIDGAGNHVASFNQGAFVWHVFRNTS